MILVIFDDCRTAFFPLTHTRIIGDLRCGILKLRQRLELLFSNDAPAHYLLPEDLIPLYKERHTDWESIPENFDDYLYLNSRIRIDDVCIQEIKDLKPGDTLTHGDSLVAMRCSDCIGIRELLQHTARYHHRIIPAKTTLYDNPAALIHDNDRMIRLDFDLVFSDKDNFFETEPGVTVLHPYNVWLGENVELKPGVILDASDGPIVIDDEVSVMSNSVIIGPCYIGKKSVVKIGAKIYHSCSIGPVCKIGGELEGTIIQAYTNKQHDGFLGHSYVGEWVNIGADTNNSDLKNTYKNVDLYSYATKQKYDSGSQFMGCLIGDHVKLGINSTVNTGTIIGTGSNIWGRDLISGYIPEFAWGQADNLSIYRLDSFLDTARIVKNRRRLDLGQSEIELLTKLHPQNMEI